MKKLLHFLFFLILLLFCYKLRLIEQNSETMSRFIPIAVASLFIVFYAYFFIRFLYNGRITSRIYIIVTLWLLYISIISFFSMSDGISLNDYLFSTFWCFCYLSFQLLLTHMSDCYRLFIKWYIVLFAFSLIGFFYCLSHPIFSDDFLMSDRLIGENSIYYPIMCLPFLLLVKKRWLRVIFLCLLLIATVMSLKRTASIILFSVIFFYVYFDFVKLSKHKVANTIIAFVMIFSFYYFFQTLSFTSDLRTRFSSFEDDRGSGREDVYGEVFQMIIQSPPTSFILGHGYNKVFVNNHGASAHDDFLEVLYDYGLAGFILYIIFHITLIKRCRLLYKRKSPYFLAYFTSYLIFLVTSLFSHLIIYPTYFTLLLIFWAYYETKVFHGSRIEYDTLIKR